MTSKRLPSRYERGTALVEFALVSVIAMTMLLGTVEFGRALYDYHLVSNAARLGTRYAIVHGSDCGKTLVGCTAATSSDIQTYVRGISPAIDPTLLTVTTTWANSPDCFGGSPYKATGCLVTVQASYTFVPVVPLIPLPSITLTSQSVMPISQ